VSLSLQKSDFDPQIRTHIDAKTGCEVPHTPQGRFIHIPPAYPSASWANDFGTPWWKGNLKTFKISRIHLYSIIGWTVVSSVRTVVSCVASSEITTLSTSDESYCIGHLSGKTRKIRIINTLTSQEHTIEVCGEETLEEILNRFYKYNQHAASYTWKYNGKFLINFN